MAEDGDRRESSGYNVAGRAGFEFYTPDRLDRVAREAVARTLVLFDAVPAPAGEMPVVLAAGSSGILHHEAIGHGMEPDFNRKKVSIYADKIGQTIAKPLATERVKEWVSESDEIMQPLKDQTLLMPDPFDQPIDYVYYELWHHWGRTAKFGIWMQGPDYSQWNGAYEVLSDLAELREMVEGILNSAAVEP